MTILNQTDLDEEKMIVPITSLQTSLPVIREDVEEEMDDADEWSEMLEDVRSSLPMLHQLRAQYCSSLLRYSEMKSAPHIRRRKARYWQSVVFLVTLFTTCSLSAVYFLVPPQPLSGMMYSGVGVISGLVIIFAAVGHKNANPELAVMENSHKLAQAELGGVVEGLREKLTLAREAFDKELLHLEKAILNRE